MMYHAMPARCGPPSGLSAVSSEPHTLPFAYVTCCMRVSFESGREITSLCAGCPPKRSRQQPTDEVEDVTSDEPDADEGARRQESVELVWAAATGLADRDRALLDLNLRQGLDGQELAEAIGVEPAHAYVLLNRLRGQVERSLGALLIARYGRADCSTLAGILEGWDGRFSPLLRKRVARHADQCEVCADRRKTLASPLALLGALPLVPAPARMREAILGQVQLAAATGGDTAHDAADTDVGDGTSWQPDADGFPPPAYPSRPSRKAMALVAALALLLGTLAVLLLKPGSDEPPGLSVASAEGPTTSTSAGTSPGGAAGPTTTAAAAPGPGPDGTSPGVAGPDPSPPGSTPIGTTVTPGLVNPEPSGATTTTTTTSPAGPVSPVGPKLRLVTTSLDFGTSSTAQGLILANDGDRPLSWSAGRVAPGAFSVDPASGTIDPGGTARTTVRLNRSTAAEGSLGGTAPIASDGGGGSVDLAATVARAPVVTASANQTRVRAPSCTAGPQFASITAEATDESGVASARLLWRDPGGATGSRNLNQSPDGSWSGRLGSFAEGGTATWWVEATDTLGNTGRSTNHSIPVDSCP